MSSVEVMVVVEGQTEQTFVRELLAPYLATRHIYLQAALLGKPGHKGGSVQVGTRPDRYWEFLETAPRHLCLDHV